MCSTLYYSRSQEHILPSRGPRHAPLVLQVVVSQYVIDWGGSLDVLQVTGKSFFVFTISQRENPPPSSSPPLPRFPLFSCPENNSSFRSLPLRQPPPLPVPVQNLVLSHRHHLCLRFRPRIRILIRIRLHLSLRLRLRLRLRISYSYSYS